MARGLALASVDTMACGSRFTAPGSPGNDMNFRSNEVLRKAEQFASARAQEEMLQYCLKAAAQQQQQQQQPFMKFKHDGTFPGLLGPGAAPSAPDGLLASMVAMLPTANERRAPSQAPALAMLTRLMNDPEYLLSMMLGEQMRQHVENKLPETSEATGTGVFVKADTGNDYASRKRAFPGSTAEPVNLLARTSDGTKLFPQGYLAQQLASSPLVNKADASSQSSAGVADAQAQRVVDPPWVKPHQGSSGFQSGGETAAWDRSKQDKFCQQMGPLGPSLSPSVQLQALLSRAAMSSAGLRMSTEGQEAAKNPPAQKELDLSPYRHMAESLFAPPEGGKGFGSTRPFDAFRSSFLSGGGQSSAVGRYPVERTSGGTAQHSLNSKEHLGNLEDPALHFKRTSTSTGLSDVAGDGKARDGPSSLEEQEQALKIVSVLFQGCCEAECAEAGRAGGNVQKPASLISPPSLFSAPSVPEREQAQAIRQVRNGQEALEALQLAFLSNSTRPDEPTCFGKTSTAVSQPNSQTTSKAGSLPEVSVTTLQLLLQQQQQQLQEQQQRQQKQEVPYVPPSASILLQTACLPLLCEEEQQPPLKRSANGGGNVPSPSPTTVIRPKASKGCISLVPPPPFAPQGSPPMYIRPLRTNKTAPPAMIAEAAEKLLRGERPLNRAMSTPTLGVFSLFGHKSVPVPSALQPSFSDEPSTDEVDTSLSLRVS